MAKAEIGNCIRKLRFENGEMTQQDLADGCGCTRQTIVSLEKGKYVPQCRQSSRKPTFRT